MEQKPENGTVKKILLNFLPENNKSAKWFFGILAIIGQLCPIIVAIILAFSYFPWVPIVYESSGIQSEIWFFYIYPLLALNLILRAFIKLAFRLRWSFLIPPIFLAIIFVPAVIFPHSVTIAIIFAISAIVMAIAGTIFDVKCLKNPLFK